MKDTPTWLQAFFAIVVMGMLPGLFSFSYNSAARRKEQSVLLRLVRGGQYDVAVARQWKYLAPATVARAVASDFDARTEVFTHHSPLTIANGAVALVVDYAELPSTLRTTWRSDAASGAAAAMAMDDGDVDLAVARLRDVLNDDFRDEVTVRTFTYGWFVYYGGVAQEEGDEAFRDALAARAPLAVLAGGNVDAFFAQLAATWPMAAAYMAHDLGRDDVAIRLVAAMTDYRRHNAAFVRLKTLIEYPPVMFANDQ